MADIFVKLFKFVVGIILIILGVLSYLWWGWYHDLVILVKGGIGLIVILIGLAFIFFAWSD